MVPTIPASSGDLSAFQAIFRPARTQRTYLPTSAHPGTQSMPIEIKAGDSPEEVLTVLAPVMHYFGATPSPQDATRFAPFIEPSRAFTAREDGAAVGGCASFPLELTVPGGVVRAAGLTIVGVLPTHRRRG